MKIRFLNFIKQSVVSRYSLLNVLRARRVSKRLAQVPTNWERQIYDKIVSGNPLLIGRLGGLEASCLGIYVDSKTKFRKPLRYAQALALKQRRQLQLCNNAGVFPLNDKTFNHFATEHLDALSNLDIFSVWAKPSAWVEFKCLDQTETLFVSGDASYPWPESRDGASEVGWGMAMDNKKVLVVTPFVDSFEAQAPKLHKIFAGVAYPKMELLFLRAPLTQGGLDDGSSYSSHLSTLKNQMSLLNFDIALVSAGAYSLPLANHAKNMGKVGVHAGGALQIFFGVTGQRYDNYSQVQRFFNIDWKRPFVHERPANWQKIEDGCYW